MEYRLLSSSRYIEDMLYVRYKFALCRAEISMSRKNDDHCTASIISAHVAVPLARQRMFVTILAFINYCLHLLILTTCLHLRCNSVLLIEKSLTCGSKVISYTLSPTSYVSNLCTLQCGRDPSRSSNKTAESHHPTTWFQDHCQFRLFYPGRSPRP